MNAKELINSGKHFCILPWVHFHSWPDGRVMPCCIADSTVPVSYAFPNESILELMNSDEYKKMRLALLNDEQYAACKRCYDLELLGTWTLRLSLNKILGEQNIDAIINTNSDGSINEFKMKYMDIRFSNICNMKCRSCGPSCSSLWANEFTEFKGSDCLKQYFNIDKPVVNINEDNVFMKKLTPYLKDVREVYFAGGEIIITPEHYECLDYWIENGINETIKLNYTTNLSVLKYKDRDLIEYWKQFPKLEIWASLDAHGLVAETIRKGTDWERIVKNIRQLKEIVPHAKFQITPTISIWNVFDFPEFFDYMVENDLISPDTSPRFNLATNPWYANIMILPSHVKAELVKKYRVYRDKYSHNRDIHNGFKMIIYNLMVGEENKGGIQEFIKFNDELDERREEKLIDIIPELKEVYEWAKS